MRLVDDMMEKHREPILYVIWGGFTTLVTWLTYALFIWVGVGLNPSNILSWVCGVMFAFAANKWMVFNSKSIERSVITREFISFIASRILTLAVAAVLFPILIAIGLDQSLFETKGFVAKIVTSIVEIILNWVLSKYFVFKYGVEKPKAS